MYDNTREQNESIYICDINTLVIETPGRSCTSAGLVDVRYSSSASMFSSDIVFSDYFDGNLCLKIEGLMAEGFRVFIDGIEYSYAIRKSGVTNPGYALIGGPYEKGCTVRAVWGESRKGEVYMVDESEPLVHEDVQGEDAKTPGSVLLRVSGADILYNENRRMFLLCKKAAQEEEPGGDIRLYASLGSRVALLSLNGQDPVQELVLAPDFEGYTMHNLRVQTQNAGGYEEYSLIVSGHPRDYESGLYTGSTADAFRTVTGSFAGELCYAISTAMGESAVLGSYNSTPNRMYGMDRKTGYFWGHTTAMNSEFLFQLEEGNYVISCSLSQESPSVSVVCEPISGGRVTQIQPGSDTRIRSTGEGIILQVNSPDDAAAGCGFKSIMIRALSTEAQVSGFIPYGDEDEEESTFSPCDTAYHTFTDTDICSEDDDETADDIHEEPDIRISAENYTGPKITVVGRHHTEKGELQEDHSCAKTAGKLAGVLALTGAVVAVVKKKL